MSVDIKRYQDRAGCLELGEVESKTGKFYKVEDVDPILSDMQERIDNMKCCSNCGTTQRWANCLNCIRYNGTNNVPDDQLVDKWSKE